MAPRSTVRRWILGAFSLGIIHLRKRPRPKRQKDFSLDNYTESGCWKEFRFHKEDILRIRQALRIPQIVRTENPRCKATGCEALCILLRRLARGGGLREMGNEFQRSRTAIAKIANHMLEIILERNDGLLTNLDNHRWLTQEQLKFFAYSIKKQGSSLDNCVGFIDGTIRPTCRPSHEQEAAYSGHKRLHGLKYQSIIFPNGLIGSLIGPYEGRRHDLGMLREREWGSRTATSDSSRP